MDTEGVCHMSDSTVLELLDQVAESVVFIDREKPEGFSTVAKGLNELASQLDEAGRATEAAIRAGSCS